jgi:hypothetical protein
MVVMYELGLVRHSWGAGRGVVEDWRWGRGLQEKMNGLEFSGNM